MLGGSGGVQATTVALKQIASNKRPRIVLPAPVVTEKNYTTRQAQSTSALADSLHNDVRIPPIIGPNGAGKSTLLRAIYGLDGHFGGTAHFRSEWPGRPPRWRPTRASR